MQFSFFSFAQRLEGSLFLNNNYFYDFKKDEGYQRTTFHNGLGYGFRLGINDIYVDQNNIELVLKYEKYKGSFDYFNGGLASTNEIHVMVDKYLIGLECYPILLKIAHKIYCNIGFDMSTLISQSTNGYSISTLGGTTYPMKEINSTINNRFYLGVVSKLSYSILIFKKVYLNPQILLSSTLTNEFKNIGINVKSFKSSVGLGIARSLN